MEHHTFQRSSEPLDEDLDAVLAVKKGVHPAPLKSGEYRLRDSSNNWVAPDKRSTKTYVAVDYVKKVSTLLVWSPTRRAWCLADGFGESLTHTTSYKTLKDFVAAKRALFRKPVKGGPCIMPSPSITGIGICGRAGAGKDFLADRIIEKASDIGLKAQKMGFADELKRFDAEIFGDNTFNRLRLQQLGSVARQHDVNVWVDKMKARLEGVDDGSVVVVKDVRFKNEAKMLLERGFTLVHLDVDGETQRIRGRGECVDSEHESERGVDELVSMCHIHTELHTLEEAQVLASKLISGDALE